MTDRNLRARLNWLDRSQIVKLLEDGGYQCYFHESEDALREALAVNIEAGSIPEPV